MGKWTLKTEAKRLAFEDDHIPDKTIWRESNHKCNDLPVKTGATGCCNKLAANLIEPIRTQMIFKTRIKNLLNILIIIQISSSIQ